MHDWVKVRQLNHPVGAVGAGSAVTGVCVWKANGGGGLLVPGPRAYVGGGKLARARLQRLYRQAEGALVSGLLASDQDVDHLARRHVKAAKARVKGQQAAGGFKVCRKCGATLGASAFNKDNSKADGLRAACKSCRCAWGFPVLARQVFLVLPVNLQLLVRLPT